MGCNWIEGLWALIKDSDGRMDVLLESQRKPNTKELGSWTKNQPSLRITRSPDSLKQGGRGGSHCFLCDPSKIFKLNVSFLLLQFISASAMEAPEKAHR